MTLEELKIHCSYFYNALHIPIYIIKSSAELVVESFPEQETCCHPLSILKHLHTPSDESVFCITSSFSAGFGIIRILNSDYVLIVGPQFAVPFSNQIYFEMSKEYHFHPEQKELIYAFFNNIPHATSLALKQTLGMMHHFLNPGLKTELFDTLNAQETETLRKNQYGEHYAMREYGYHNNSIEIEREICKIVETGNLSAFEKYIHNAPYLTPGITSLMPLRQKKNIALASVTVLSRAAIRGGMETNAALLLSDNYIQHIESSITDRQIDALLADMSSQYVHAVADIRAQRNTSHTVDTLIQYVREHVNEPVSVHSMAMHFGYNPDYLSHKFKNKTGFGLKPFIKRTKLEEAAQLLKYTNQSILEISNYLCFSSQSNFQNAFKEQYHLTPKQYRALTRKTTD